MAVAFKEWAVVVDALLDGRQVVTLRKGGIAEEGGRFVPDEPAFWLYPTFEHQSAEVVAPEERDRYARVLAAPRDVASVSIPGHAECVDVLEVRDEAAARRLAAETIWTPEAVQSRFRMMPGRPLYAMVLRVRRLPAPVEIPFAESYKGCRSWVELSADAAAALPDPAGLAPVLDDSTFEARRRTIPPLASSRVGARSSVGESTTLTW